MRTSALPGQAGVRIAPLRMADSPYFHINRQGPLAAAPIALSFLIFWLASAGNHGILSSERKAPDPCGSGNVRRPTPPLGAGSPATEERGLVGALACDEACSFDRIERCGRALKPCVYGCNWTSFLTHERLTRNTRSESGGRGRVLENVKIRRKQK